MRKYMEKYIRTNEKDCEGDQEEGVQGGLEEEDVIETEAHLFDHCSK